MSGSARINNKGTKRWIGGHPWIYRSDVIARPDSPAGAVIVEDQRGKALGWALWSPKSEISLRMIDSDARERIDAAWWKRRLAKAAARRDILKSEASAFRIVHGEGDGCPSLICD